MAIDLTAMLPAINFNTNILQIEKSYLHIDIWGWLLELLVNVFIE